MKKEEEQQQLCSDCGEVMRRTQTPFTVDYSSDVGVVRRVPTLVCNDCGLQWIEGNARKNRNGGQ